MEINKNGDQQQIPCKVYSLPMRNGNCSLVQHARRSERVYSLPMRNGNEGCDLEEAIEARFIVYLWGMEIVLVPAFKRWLGEVYSLPMRNGNLTSFLARAPVIVRFIVYLWGMEIFSVADLWGGEDQEFIVYLWGMEISSNDGQSRAERVYSLPMRNGNAEAKARVALAEVQFIVYLWGMEILLHSYISYALADVYSLPMRNGNDLINDYMKLYDIVYSLPMRNGNWDIQRIWNVVGKFIVYLWGMEICWQH